MKQILIWSAALCVCLLSPAFSAQPVNSATTARSVPKSVSIPFTATASGEIVVQANVTCPDNQVRPMHMLVDTGTTMTFITPEAAETLGLATTDARDADATADDPGKLTVTSMAYIPALSIGTLTGGRYSLPVIRDEVLEHLGEQVDGVLGMDMLQHYGMLIDFHARTLTFTSRSAAQDTLLSACGMTGAAAVDMISTSIGYVCTCRLNLHGRTIEEPLLLDTGSVDCFLGSDIAAKVPARQQDPVAATAVIGSKPMTVAKAAAVIETMGGWHAGIPVDVALQLTGPSLPVGSILGLNALRHYRVLIDFSHSKMYLDSQPDRYARAGETMPQQP